MPPGTESRSATKRSRHFSPAWAPGLEQEPQSSLRALRQGQGAARQEDDRAPCQASGRFAGGSAGALRIQSDGSAVEDAWFRFDQLPGYQELHIQKEAAEHLGIANPFFKLHQRVARNTTVIGNREHVNYASYNYLDLCGHEEVGAAAKEAIDRYGTSASASRPVSGERPVQGELEAALAEMYGVEDCVVLVGGWATNVTTIGHLFGRKDLILHDALIHNSVLQARCSPGRAGCRSPTTTGRRSTGSCARSASGTSG